MQRALSRVGAHHARLRAGMCVARTYAGGPPRPPAPPRTPSSRDTVGEARPPPTPAPSTKSGRLAYLVTGDGRSVPPAQRKREFDAEMDDSWLGAATFERPRRGARKPRPRSRDGENAGVNTTAATTTPAPAWPGTPSWRDLDPSKLPPRAKENASHDHRSPDTVIVPHARRIASVTWACRLFRATSTPATGVVRGGAPDLLPPFEPRVRHGLMPDGTPPPPDAYSSAAARSPDARAGSGFKYPVPGTVRAFVLASKARVSRFTTERRRVRNRFIKAYEHVVNRSPTPPPLSHERVYTFILEAKLYDAPFLEICEAVERAILELDRRAKAPPGVGVKKPQNNKSNRSSGTRNARERTKG